MMIYEAAFDFDNCLFHRGYVWPSDDDNTVITQNTALIDYIKHKINLHDRAFVSTGSNRQDKYWDDGCSRSSGLETESSFIGLEKMAKELKAELDPFLLADIYADKPDGSTFRDYFDENIGKSQHNRWCYDSSKLSIVYSKTHRRASQFPTDKITFNFFDDKGNGVVINDEQTPEHLLEDLQEFYCSHPKLLPSNVTLQLHHYEGDAITPYFQIQGQGPIDAIYRNTTVKMSKLAQHSNFLEPLKRDVSHLTQIFPHISLTGQTYPETLSELVSKPISPSSVFNTNETFTLFSNSVHSNGSSSTTQDSSLFTKNADM